MTSPQTPGRVESSTKFVQRWKNFWRRVYHPLGFHKGYNFPLFVICVGALMGFTLARFQYLSINGKFLQSTMPGDAVEWLSGHHRVGIIIHLACVLPASFLVCFQFVPVIRHKLLIFHRINGYIVIILFLVSLAGAYMIIPVAAGGTPSTQAGIGVIATTTLISITLAYINIKKLQIEQHRAWMLRTWVIAGSIITMRIIQGAAIGYIARHPGGDWYDVQTCGSIYSQWVLKGIPPAAAAQALPQAYPQCTAANVSVAIQADMRKARQPEVLTAVLHLTFGMAVWLGFFIHLIGVELYLHLTPAEAQRLRQVSYEKQLEAGYRTPGRGGLTADRCGDAPEWQHKDALARRVPSHESVVPKAMAAGDATT